ncbi:MAG: sensor histidine kinase [Planctomycetes bacterium]|nr:sensor histidine kinase [Planctomycetota bacterium]
MNFIEKLTPRRLWQQIGLAFGLLMLISLMALGGLLITASRAAVRDSVLRDYQEICRNTAQQLNDFIDKPQALLVNTAGILGATGIRDSETQKLLLYRMVTDYPHLFERVAIVSADGKEIISSDIKSQGTTPLPPFAKGEWLVNSPLIKGDRGLLNSSSISQVYFSAEHLPYVTITAPINTPQGLSGMLMAEVKLNSIWGIIGKIKLGQGQILIVDEQGYVLVHKEERKVYQSENLKGTPVVQAVLGGQNGSREDLTSGWLSAYAPISAFGWGLIIRQPVKDAYAFSNRMQAKAVLIIGLAILTAIVVGLMIANKVTRPVKTLIDATDQVGAGNLDQVIKSARTDEMGGLLNAFDNMITRLRQAKRLEKLSAIGTATSKIAHEIRNPLVGVKTFVQLLPKRYQDPKFIAQFNDTVPHEMVRLEKMMGALSDFSAIRRLNVNRINLAGLINETLTLFREQMFRDNIKSDIDIKSDQLFLNADPDKLKQVLINLIQNALQAMAPGGALRISAGLNGSGMIIKVGDTGTGMDAAQLATLFEPFQTSKKAGLGLGLTICKEIIEQHQGAISVTSQKNQGTEFTIKLPTEPQTDIMI